MRPLEALLIFANLLTFLTLILPPLRALRWTTYLAPIVLLIVGVQVVEEGPRWQMIPAYALAGSFFLAWVWLNPTIASPRMPVGSRRTNRIATGLGVGLGILALTLSGVLPIVVPVFRFTHPTGPDGIGTLTYDWTDSARPEIFTVDPADHRELMVQIWYPARPTATSPRAPYVQDANAVAPGLARLFHFPAVTFEAIKYVSSNAVAAAAVADDAPNYPVLIFLEGFNGFRQMNTYQVEELVSHGYVVVAIDQPYAAAATVFADGRQVQGWERTRLAPLVNQSISPAESPPALNGQELKDGIIPYLAQDVIFTLDQLTALNHADPHGILTGRLDLQRVGVFGVSLGGIVGAEACRLDSRLRALLVEDAPMPADVVQTGLQQPTMWISRDVKTMQLEGWSKTDPGAGIDISQNSMRAVFKSLPRDGYLVLVRGMFHLNLTDIAIWSPLTPMLGMTGPIDGQRAHSIVNAYSLAFFDRYLRGQPAALLDGPEEQYPEVLFEIRRP